MPMYFNEKPKICDLKIRQDLYELITSYKKIYEIRQMDKYYIYKNDIIRYKDIDGLNKKALGYAIVIKRDMIATEELLKRKKYILDGATYKFVQENYKDIPYLIVLEIIPLEWKV